MKIFAALSVLICINIHMYAQQSNIVFFAPEGEQFFVFLDGVKQNNNPSNNVKIYGMENLQTNLLILIVHPQSAIINNFLAFAPSKESWYLVKRNTQNIYSLFQSDIFDVALAPKGINQLAIKHTTTLPPPNFAQEQPIGYQVPGGGYTQSTTGAGQGNMNININMSNLINQTSTNSNVNANTPEITPSNTPIVYVPGYDGPIGCPVPMTENAYRNAKSSIASKSFESSKLSIAKQITGSNCLTAAQVKELMLLFDFEGSKLEYAKFAYDKTYDKGNYFLVNDAFDFESSVQSLNKFIGTH
jgi:hypothetical protein